MLRCLSLDIICSSKLTAFLELRSRKTVRISEQIMSADKYPSIFSRQMEAIVYIYSYSGISQTNAPIDADSYSYSPQGKLSLLHTLVRCFLFLELVHGVSRSPCLLIT